MAWTVEILNDDVEAEMMALPRGLEAKLARTLKTVEAVGLENMREPHVKHLEGKLWELRVKAAEGIARGIYITAKGRRLIVLHVFIKKTQKTPKIALEKARRRMQEVQ